MAICRKCDRCGKIMAEYNGKERRFQVSIQSRSLGGNEANPNRPVEHPIIVKDFCEDCYFEFRNMIRRFGKDEKEKDR